MAAVNKITRATLPYFRLFDGNKGFLGVRSFSVEATEATKDGDSRKQKISKAMKAYLERAKAHEEFMIQAKHEFNVGKRHLANIMRLDPDMITQEEIDESIKYLLPSGLFQPNARPMMRPPEEVFPKTKAAEFDITGRPHHYLFYTSIPNFAHLLHEISAKIDELNDYEDKMIRQQRKPNPEDAINTMGSAWIGREALEKVVLEKIFDVEFDKFIKAMDRLLAHPYSYLAKDFIQKYRVSLAEEKKQVPILEPQVAEDGRRFVEMLDVKRKKSIGKVKVTVPGTGLIKINGKEGIGYFTSDFARNQAVSYFIPKLYSADK